MSLCLFLTRLLLTTAVLANANSATTFSTQTASSAATATATATATGTATGTGTGTGTATATAATAATAAATAATTTTTTTARHAAEKKKTEHDTHVLQGVKVRAGAVNLSGGEILYRPVFGSIFGSKNEAMQDFVASFLFRSSATAEVLHVQLTTPIVKCEPAWKLRKINVALMFNHKRSHPRTLAACGIMSIMMFLFLC